jgi:hypothetical protein
MRSSIKALFDIRVALLKKHSSRASEKQLDIAFASFKARTIESVKAVVAQSEADCRGQMQAAIEEATARAG